MYAINQTLCDFTFVAASQTLVLYLRLFGEVCSASPLIVYFHISCILITTPVLRKQLWLSDLRNVWFQHDGAPPHKVSSVQQYIRDTFQQHVICYGGCVEWPPRSPDLNPLDFFLWGYIKQRVYAIPPPTLQELRNRITDACASVSPAMLYNVQREVQSLVQMCIVAEGHHFEHNR
ncbi:hypothetical protein AVEN_23260-1 [Araneus ventricosus]|uniref:Tc1-like transposase DDE domain-containing protein n=1 Tax=Araneus ventricosus TaxID=182803 RepID=A0A4Y2K1X0_ARAVE|nr:hypothetical protein AVEN_23260-1 [Araneus ventricosus]